MVFAAAMAFSRLPGGWACANTPFVAKDAPRTRANNAIRRMPVSRGGVRSGKPRGKCGGRQWGWAGAAGSMRRRKPDELIDGEHNLQQNQNHDDGFEPKRALGVDNVGE